MQKEQSCGEEKEKQPAQAAGCVPGSEPYFASLERKALLVRFPSSNISNPTGSNLRDLQFEADGKKLAADSETYAEIENAQRRGKRFKKTASGR